MAFLNIVEWSSGQVAKWLNGLDNVLHQYIPLFVENYVNGQRLLTLRCDDLETLRINVIGHQEILLEAVERLRNFHYEVSRENVQQLALRVACAANSLRGEVDTSAPTHDLPTRVLADVAHLIATVKPLVCWLDRSPFNKQPEYCERKARLLQLSLEASICAHRGRFAETPSAAVADLASRLAALADYIVQDVTDPMILQPASLESVCIKKKDNQLGFEIVPSFGGHYQVANIKFGSPAHASGKIEEGDEIVYANYHTVVGWSLEAVRQACRSPPSHDLYQGNKFQDLSPDDLVLTLRRRPAARSAELTTPQLRPFRPIKRTWAEFNVLFLQSNKHFDTKEAVRSNENRKRAEAVEEDSSSEESDSSSPPSSPVHPTKRIFLPKPRFMVQRRNTISGSSPISKRPNVSIEQFWQELKNHKKFNHTGSAQMRRTDDDDQSIELYRRNKAQSCSTGLELTPRPTTFLGVESNIASNVQNQIETEIEGAKNRGKLDKSHSTPAYDFGNSTEKLGSLVTQIIPESPATPTDSPTIIIHSAEKADQILNFKKSSCQIGEAIKQQSKHREDLKFDFAGMKHSNNQVLETINIAMMEQQMKDKKTLTKNSKFETQTTNTETGETSTQTLLVNEKVHIIQNEIVEAINVHRLVHSVSNKTPAEEPPVPPPRPPSTLKPNCVPREYIIPVQDNRLPDFPPLKPEKTPESPKDYHPLKHLKYLDATQMSPPIKHIRKQDIQVIPNAPIESLTNNYFSITTTARDLDPKLSPRLNKPESPVQSNVGLTKGSEATLSPHRSPLIVISPTKIESPKLLSPTNSVVRGIFPSSKQKSLKKKNSILAKRRKVSVKDLSHSDLQGLLFQRCRTKSNCVVWDQKWYVLVSNTLYGFKNKDASKSDCLIFLNGFTVSTAQEVKSKPFAFKVYHTGTAFYFAAETEELMNTWYEYISKATMLNYDSWERAHKKEKKVDESKHYSETDYSDEDFHSDKEGNEKANEVKEKDKSKFNSLKKFIHRAESSENVSHSSSSLDRKYFGFFSSKSKHKDDNKNKHVSPKLTEQHRGSKRITQGSHLAVVLQTSNSTSDLSKAAKAIGEKQSECLGKEDESSESDVAEQKRQGRIAKHMNYIHASNPNLLNFEKSDFNTRPSINVSVSVSKKQRPDLGFVTLEEFMLKKQEEERKEIYSNRVLLGIEKVKNDEKSAKKAKDLQKQLDRIIPDVIYGELPPMIHECPTLLKEIQNRCLPKTPEKPPEHQKPKVEYTIIPLVKTSEEKVNFKPMSIKGKDGYEKIVYTPTDTQKPENETLEQSMNTIPPKILPRKPMKDIKSPDKKSAVDSAKELGYETIFGDEPINKHVLSSSNSISTNSSKDVETANNSIHSTSNNSISSEMPKLSPKMSDEMKKPLPPPKIMPKSKQVLNRPSSLSATANRHSGPDLNPVFVQGESPQQFWLNSLRRNDKVHQAKSESPKGEKFFTKRSEPSAMTKSSEATIVKSKVFEQQGVVRSEEKVLKSAAQYKPMALPIVTGGTSLKTSPQFQMTLDTNTREPPPSGGISRLRQIFQSGSGQASVSSPKSKRSMFRKQSTHTTTEDWSHDFSYTKIEHPPKRDTQPADEPCDGIVTLRNLNIPDYPHLEYPPTFEAEVYSLADPDASLQILRRKRNE